MPLFPLDRATQFKTMLIVLAATGLVAVIGIRGKLSRDRAPAAQPAQVSIERIVLKPARRIGEIESANRD